MIQGGKEKDGRNRRKGVGEGSGLEGVLSVRFICVCAPLFVIVCSQQARKTGLCIGDD